LNTYILELEEYYTKWENVFNEAYTEQELLIEELNQKLQQKLQIEELQQQSQPKHQELSVCENISELSIVPQIP